MKGSQKYSSIQLQRRSSALCFQTTTGIYCFKARQQLHNSHPLRSKRQFSSISTLCKRQTIPLLPNLSTLRSNRYLLPATSYLPMTKAKRRNRRALWAKKRSRKRSKKRRMMESRSSIPKNGRKDKKTPPSTCQTFSSELPKKRLCHPCPTSTMSRC